MTKKHPGRPKELGDNPVRFQLRLSQEQRDWLDLEADRLGRWREDGVRSVADVVRGLIDKAMRRKR